MRFFRNTSWLPFLVLMLVLGCSRPESRLVGKWMNEKTSSTIEFNKDKTGAIYQRNSPNLPPNIPFKWTMLKDDEFQVEVGAPGSTNAPAAHGRLTTKDTLLLENDTFKKMK
jgi:hypothetical protein